ncbi:MAG TPA: WbuC family cupin fold metalloprotein [Bacteroidales bacterium]|nr:WbuC family cupin fold metalloprotein [Bacteroidales bacterium]HNZ43263.1 WbuC family cupin fold metalloprotein [Bacteroidales bacterium]HPB24624.1 WbuC family cupin fold metalloprotein [Bacteroidales bacterium]HPI29839.1 WbuC family cupin fold metalloprotein [Bacteroidales bacterium]HQN15121.1 WbuC family cupin fold metalloprotein [Bacteroidales bacterium]
MIKTGAKILDDLSTAAAGSARQRKNHNFHRGEHEVLQRMLNALCPGTYIRPHKHADPGKNEVFIILRGKALVVEFDKDGNISDNFILDKTCENYAAEIPPEHYHTIIALDAGTVVYEIKEGPYSPVTDKIFAPWSPEEGSQEATSFLHRIFDEVGISCQ